MKSQFKMDLGQEGAEYRDHLRLIPPDPAKATGTVPYVSTPNEMGNALRNTMLGRRDVMFFIGNIRMPPKPPLCVVRLKASLHFIFLYVAQTTRSR